ncbi:hypothetical protein [Flagellimonas allohymeniacidonis]|uniref:Uncharacterized protein n=1 Tax=Flagellimonas allohymeniacidonis TaxID=2517819 RepID=A0A4Q8QGM7_9FLAO|nr:hypothetical protein [Allomuricauda hymeniacidonis]TAI49705.1 hypothetical protein EW142_07885 [Allomuricauda hymeniacidonis]
MKLSKVQWTLLVVGVFLTLTGIYGKTIGWDKNDFITFFYTGTSFMWIAFLDNRRSKRCYWRKKKTEEAQTLK